MNSQMEIIPTIILFLLWNSSVSEEFSNPEILGCLNLY